MIKRILVFGLVFSLIAPDASLVLAEFPDVEGIASELKITTKEPLRLEEGYTRVRCPSCQRGFDIVSDPSDMEFKKGIKRVTCPYDGVEFYPDTADKKGGQLRYEEVRCPTCGKKFKAYVDTSAILAGESQVLICPYDKGRFYFKVEGFRPDDIKLANFVTVMCPIDRRTFKAYINPKDARELTCPYDGARFFPIPELIVEQIGVVGVGANGLGNISGAASSVGIGRHGQGPSGVEMTSAMTQIPTLPSAGVPKALLFAERPSRVEEMFSEHIPLTVSKAIKQFGYEVFKLVEKAKPGKEGAEQETTAAGRTEGRLLKTLLSPGQGDKMFGSEEEILGGPSAFITPSDMPAISDYILGPGDTLKVAIWGQVQEVIPLTIDAEGRVLLPKIGPLYLWGIKFSDAERLIEENLLKAYTNIEVSVSLSRLRGIKVFVLGEAERPGAYTVSSLSNAFHAIYAAGGPTKFGSMRNIKLTRKDSPSMPIDIYNILLKGDNSQDYKLRSNDTIFIPSIGDVVGIAGNVKRPAIYELKDKIKLSDIIDMAGGLSFVGYLQRIQLERIHEHSKKVVLDLEFKSLSDLKNSPENLELQGGDLILVFPITPTRYNFVSISGNILRPGDYELKGGMRLKDLIDKAGGILPGTYLKRAEISRFKGDQTRETIPVSLTDLMDGREEVNLTLKEWDTVTIYVTKDILPDLFVEIDGAVNKPGKYELTENMKISDLIFRAGGLKSSAFLSNADLFKSFSDSGAKVFNCDLNLAMSKDAAEAGKNDLVLEEGDHLFIREDVLKGEQFLITLSGEFKYPGKYAVEKGIKLSEVIKRAGGFTNSAFLDGCIFTRESVRIAQQRMLKNFLNSEQEALLQEQSSLAVGLTSAQAESRNRLIEYRQNLMRKLETMEMPGRVLIKLNADTAKFENSECDIPIEDGDALRVPTYPSTVQILGNVYGPGVVTFSEGKGMEYYINKVGGLNKYADPNRIFIIRANGETVSSFVKAVKIRRGDTIIIPEDFRYRTLPGLMFKDFIQVLYQAALGAAVALAAINTM